MSKSINLNSSEFDSNQVVVFNNGKAGVVENVKVSIEKGEEGKPVNYPDYHLKFTDPNGGIITKGFYYLSEEDTNFSKRLVGMGSELKHVWGVLVGDVPIPEFTSHTEMLDTMMLEFRKAVSENPDDLFRTIVNYGSLDYPQEYLRVAFFPPYLESMEVTSDSSRLRLAKNARMTPFSPDKRDADYSNVHDTEEEEKPKTSGWG
jgi:hypothetical protein